MVYDRLRTCLEQDEQQSLEFAIASELLDHLVAGHETTGITFTYMMWELSRHPELQHELRRELLSLNPTLEHPLYTGDAEGSLPYFPSPAAIDSLPLLDAMVRETLRLYPPAPQSLLRVTPSTREGTSLNGYDSIPAGVRVSSSAYSLHRVEDVYPSAEEWLPKRWLRPEEGKLHDMRRLWFPFGSGGRLCLESNFAMQGT